MVNPCPHLHSPSVCFVDQTTETVMASLLCSSELHFPWSPLALQICNVSEENCLGFPASVCSSVCVCVCVCVCLRGVPRQCTVRGVCVSTCKGVRLLLIFIAFTHAAYRGRRSFRGGRGRWPCIVPAGGGRWGRGRAQGGEFAGRTIAGGLSGRQSVR